MGNGGLKLGGIKFNHLTAHSKESEKVAVIGMAGRVNRCKDLAEFWELLKQGREAGMGLSENRLNDIRCYLKRKGMSVPQEDEAYVKGSFFDDITGFDASFFGISQTEANLMDPNQRIFLETAWHALEDAGWAHDGIKGSDTGVYLGYSSDFGISYREMFKEVMNADSDIAVSGNIDSITASRISYLMDLKGPAVLVDTACSSGLTAMYMAFRALQNRECKMAVAGSVNCNVLPLVMTDKIPIGTTEIQRIHAPDAHTRTFDDRCQGTVNAEGSFAFVLKPLKAAQRDKDRILAVIIGGAMNQDGSSNGLTAPNSKAQEELITKAMIDAGIPADSISYLEAHGTATPLGDPVEISGIQNAFRHFTDKKQFCAIGSLKTNIGHLDNASGLGGVAKVILSMRHNILPASLHFNQPNRKIPFIQSPVFVNTRSVPWKREEGRPLRAGINSFGLSGTNCHIIFESWDEEGSHGYARETPAVLPISARSPAALRSLAQAYLDFLQNTAVDLAAVAYTAAACRKHHSIRLAVVFHSQQELIDKLAYFLHSSDDLKEKGIYTGEHRMILPETELSRMADYYVRGGDMAWEYMPAAESVRKTELPLYPFEHARCWPEIKGETVPRQHKSLRISQSMQALDTTIAVIKLSASECWELAEHRIGETCILPGTAYLEIMMDILRQQVAASGPLHFGNIFFAYPFSLEEYETRSLHVLIEKQKNQNNIRFVSRSENNEWIEHARAGYQFDTNDIPQAVDIAILKDYMNQEMEINTQDDLSRGLMLGGHWQSSVKTSHRNPENREFLVELSLQPQYLIEAEFYQLHPALMDIAVNAANNCIDREELFLPLSYGSLTVYRRLPAQIVVHLIRTDGTKSSRVHKFNVNIYDLEGEIILTAENYCVKSTSDSPLHQTIKSKKMIGCQQFFVKNHQKRVVLPVSGVVVIVGNGTEKFRMFEKFYLEKGYEVNLIDLKSRQDLDPLLETLKKQPVSVCLFIWDPPSLEAQMIREWEQEANAAVFMGFRFLKQWAASKIKSPAGIIAITTGACHMPGEHKKVHPGQAALMGMWRAAAEEFGSLNLRCLEVGYTTSLDVVHDEIFNAEGEKFLAFYQDASYLPELRPIMSDSQEKEFKQLGDVFVISGGTGDLGLEVATLLADKKADKLILLSSRPLPPKEQWRHLIAENQDADLSRKLTKLIELEQRIKVLQIYPINLGEYADIKKIIDKIRRKYGRISGIFHLAGRAGNGFLYHKSEAQFCSVYDGKANGAWNFHLATIDDPPEIFISFSSITALVMEAGQTDYTAANMFLDALSVYRRQNGLHSVSIQWPAWKDTGMARRMGAIDGISGEAALSTGEAIEILDNVLCNIQTVPPAWMPGQLTRAAGIKKPEPEAQKQTVVLTGIQRPDEIQLKVAGIWAGTLGITTLDIDDDFNSLGGNSLLISKMLNLYEAFFPGKMEIADLFTYTTAGQQAEYLAQQSAAQPEAEQMTDVNKILARLARGEITVEESSELLSNASG